MASQATSQNNTFLNTWNNTRGPDATVHLGLNSTECLACHSSTAGFVGAGATEPLREAVRALDLHWLEDGWIWTPPARGAGDV